MEGTPLDEEGVEHLIAAMERVGRFEEEAPAEGIVHDQAPDVGPFLMAGRPPMILIGADGSRGGEPWGGWKTGGFGENVWSRPRRPEDGLARRRARAALGVEKFTATSPGMIAENMGRTGPDCR